MEMFIEIMMSAKYAPHLKLMMSSQIVHWWTNQQAPGRIWILSTAISPENSPPLTPLKPIWNVCTNTFQCNETINVEIWPFCVISSKVNPGGWMVARGLGFNLQGWKHLIIVFVNHCFTGPRCKMVSTNVDTGMWNVEWNVKAAPVPNHLKWWFTPRLGDFPPGKFN